MRQNKMKPMKNQTCRGLVAVVWLKTLCHFKIDQLKVPDDFAASSDW